MFSYSHYFICFYFDMYFMNHPDCQQPVLGQTSLEDRRFWRLPSLPVPSPLSGGSRASPSLPSPGQSADAAKEGDEGEVWRHEGEVWRHEGATDYLNHV